MKKTKKYSFIKHYFYILFFLLIVFSFLGCEKNNYGFKGLDTSKKLLEITNKNSYYDSEATKLKNVSDGKYLVDSNEDSLSLYQSEDIPGSKYEYNDNDLKNVFEIREKMFINQCNEIYLNPKDYNGRIVKLQGMYDGYVDIDTGERSSFIFRYGPGCCGNDGVAGFELLYEGKNIPEINDWIEVLGVATLIKSEYYETVALKVISIKVLKNRGAEFVKN